MITNFENTKPQLNDDVLKTIENYFNISLPKPYKKYLLEINGGISKKNIFFFRGMTDGSSTHHWYGVRSEPNFSLLKEMHDRGERYPKHFIAICDDSFGNKLLLSLKNPDYGKIYFWDHELEADPNQGETPDYSNLTLVADSFEEFVNGLKDESEIGNG